MRRIAETLAALRAEGLLRELRALSGPPGPRVLLGGRERLHLASNNYLDLAAHPAVKEAAIRAIERWGWGAGASALISGHTELHEALAARLAAFEKAEACVLFPSGWQANLGTIGALAGAGDRVILDKLCHASLIDGARLSGAEIRIYPHLALGKLERLLAEPAQGRTLVVTDTVFSMDGDCAPLAGIADLAARAGAMLMIDEAHATGLLGSRGGGAVEAEEEERGVALRAAIPVRMGTLSKALGGAGGFVAGSRDLCSLLTNRARAMIYTTAPPPAAAAAALAALDLVAAEPWRRTTALERAAEFRGRLERAGVTRDPEAPVRQIDGPAAIVAVVVGAAESALRLAARLLEAGILCPAIRPPTVPRGASRLRFSWTAGHGAADVALAADALTEALRAERLLP